MANDMTETDHDILTTLVANTKELRQRQIELAAIAADNHKEIKQEIQDLKNGYADRLAKVEMGKLSSLDFVQFRNTEFAPLFQDVKDLKSWQNKIVGALIILNILLGVAIFVVNKVW